MRNQTLDCKSALKQRLGLCVFNVCPAFSVSVDFDPHSSFISSCLMAMQTRVAGLQTRQLL